MQIHERQFCKFIFHAFSLSLRNSLYSQSHLHLGLHVIDMYCGEYQISYFNQ